MKRFLIIIFTNNDTKTLQKGFLMVGIDCAIEEEQSIIDAIVNNKDGLLDIINKYQQEQEKTDFAQYYQNTIHDDIASLTVEAILFACSDNTPTDTCNRCIKNYTFDDPILHLWIISMLATYFAQHKTYFYSHLTQIE